uniref:Uncharacterized protein n=1 Tax=Solanum lycopersicum TaxID=4081 RepID=A0A3Q7J3I3_SOLLC
MAQACWRGRLRRFADLLDRVWVSVVASRSSKIKGEGRRTWGCWRLQEMTSVPSGTELTRRRRRKKRFGSGERREARVGETRDKGKSERGREHGEGTVF